MRPIRMLVEDVSHAKLKAAIDRNAHLRLAYKESNHRIANNLQLISGLLGLQARETASEEAKLAIKVAMQRIHAVGQYHAHLCQHQCEGVVQFDELLKEHLENTAFSLGLDISITAEPTPMSSDLALDLLTVVNELVINARKHAYGETEEGVVRIACHLAAGRDVRICVTDEGVGLPEGFSVETCDGVGFRVIASTMRGLGGAIRTKSGGAKPGASFILTAPAEPDAAAAR